MSFDCAVLAAGCLRMVATDYASSNRCESETVTGRFRSATLRRYDSSGLRWGVQ